MMLLKGLFGLATVTNTKICPQTQTEAKLQAFYKVIKGVREKLKNLSHFQ